MPRRRKYYLSQPTRSHETYRCSIRITMASRQTSFSLYVSVSTSICLTSLSSFTTLEDHRGSQRRQKSTKSLMSNRNSNAAPRRFNPSRFVSKWSTPQLVIHSGKDYRLPETDGIGAFHALQQYIFSLWFPVQWSGLIHFVRRGVPSRFLYYPDENHWVLKPENSLKWHHEVFKWIAEFIGEDD